MKKIITGFLGLVVVAGLVGGAAYALFSSQATASGLEFATGNANLQISVDGNYYYPVWNFGNAFFDGLFPGSDVTGTQFLLKNSSSSNFALTLTGVLTSGGSGDWGALKDVVTVGFDYFNGTWQSAPGFATLDQWNTIGYTLPGGNLANGDQRWYRIHVQVPSTADNSIANKSLTGAIFTFTGTQVP
jgi:predicted ribosomally synthesized peptide with SipW-like signal peptide